MALQKTRLGTNEDGTPAFHYRGEHVVITGSASGVVVLADGTEVDVTDAVVEADSVEHAQQIATAIALAVGADEAVEPASKTTG